MSDYSKVHNKPSTQKDYLGNINLNIISILGRMNAQDVKRPDAAGSIAAETGLTHRPVAEGEHVSSAYRHSVKLASGRFAMLDDDIGFSLVPGSR